MVTDDFNGLRELLAREDNVQCLINMLQEINLETLPQKNNSNINIGDLVLRHTFMEAMLSHESVIAHATPEQQKQIVALGAKNISLKQLRPEAYSHLSVEASAYLLGAGLKGINGSVTSELDLFLQTGSLRSDAQINELKSLASGIINTLKP